MNSYLNLQAEPRPLKLLDEPDGYISAMAKSNLGHQMRYSVELLEKELADEGSPRILQLKIDGSEHDPAHWSLYANGILVASGAGAYARQCFERDARSFLERIRDAVTASSEHLDDRGYRSPSAARSIARAEASIVS